MGLLGRDKTVTKCKQCGTELKDPERLKKHIEKAHNKILEKCRICEAEFHTYDDLRKHKKKCR